MHQNENSILTISKKIKRNSVNNFLKKWGIQNLLYVSKDQVVFKNSVKDAGLNAINWEIGLNQLRKSLKNGPKCIAFWGNCRQKTSKEASPNKRAQKEETKLSKNVQRLASIWLEKVLFSDETLIPLVGYIKRFYLCKWSKPHINW